MSDDPSEDARKQLRDFRSVVADAIGELRSQEARDTYAAITLEDLLNRHVTNLSTGDGYRPSRLQRLQKVRDDLNNNIQTIMATPPDAFRVHDAPEDVNA